MITFLGVLCLKDNSNIAAKSIIFNNLSVFDKSISFLRYRFILSSINSDLSKVPVTTSLINFCTDFLENQSQSLDSLMNCRFFEQP